jgi:opacity protein-like surface antigen
VNGEFNYSEIGGRFNNFNPGGVAQGDEYRTDVEWFASVRGRLGFIFPSAPELMAYAIGGVAFARIEGVEGDALNGSLNCANDCAKDKITDVGYTVGGGLAWQLPRSVTGMTVIINLEYAYYDFGTNEFSTTAQTSGSPHVFDAETDFHTGRIGVGIKF